MITLATLPQSSEQDVFDQVLAHARTQQAYCEIESENFTTVFDIPGAPLPQEGVKGKIFGCFYRKNGLKCFAGCLIADEEYSSNFEGMIWSGLVANKYVPNTHMSLITALQKIHDFWKIDFWEQQFQKVAEEFNLEYKAENAS